MRSAVPSQGRTMCHPVLSATSRLAGSVAKLVRVTPFMYQIWVSPVEPLCQTRSGEVLPKRLGTATRRQPVLSVMFSDASRFATEVRVVPVMYQIWVCPVVPLCHTRSSHVSPLKSLAPTSRHPVVSGTFKDESRVAKLLRVRFDLMNHTWVEPVPPLCHTKSRCVSGLMCSKVPVATSCQPELSGR